ncbi:MAG: glycosyltransferase family 2 protein [Candidatus Micrarchaeota archaeon]|nr:glycosyltransferase family 2 protein [Candidatus Micrarchaeota archaeon]
MKVTLLFSAYREGKGVGETVRKLSEYAQKSLREYEIEIIGIDDGSNDGTYEALVEASKKYGIIAEKNPVNMGQGAAFRRGFARASGEVIITMDSDLSYPIGDIPKLLAKIEEGYDLVLTSPFTRESRMENAPFIRLFLSKVGSLIYSVTVGARISCYTGAFRAYRAGMAKKLEFRENRFGAQVEIIWLANRLGYRIAEVPSILSVRKREDRGSSFKVVKGIIEHLRLLAVLVIRDLKGKIGMERLVK